MKYPRGKYQAHLGTLGLMGKIHITEDMSVEEVAMEVRSVFKEPMDSRNDFPSATCNLPTGSGSRTLSIPSVSSSFCWTAKQVAQLGNNTGTIYILANDDLILDDDDEGHKYINSKIILSTWQLLSVIRDSFIVFQGRGEGGLDMTLHTAMYAKTWVGGDTNVHYCFAMEQSKGISKCSPQAKFKA